MALIYGLKVTESEFQKEADWDLSKPETAMLMGDLNGAALASYVQARVRRDFFRSLMKGWQAWKHQPEHEEHQGNTFVDYVTFRLNELPNVIDPLSRPSNPLTGIIDDMHLALNINMASHLRQLAKYDMDPAKSI